MTQTTFERDGGTSVRLKGGGDTLLVRLDAFKPMCDAWNRGDTFFNTFDIYGDSIAIKLSEVSAIWQNTTEATANADEDKQILKARFE